MKTLARLGWTAALALSALALASCASMEISSYVVRGVNLTQYRTYDWGPADTFTTGDPRLDDNRFFDERVRAQVERHLAAKGFEKNVVGPADLRVHYHANVTQRIYARELDRQYGYCDEDECDAEVYDAGTLVIDLVDNRDNKLIWRGWAEDSIEGVLEDQEWLEAKVDDAVARILEQLPSGL